MSAELHVKTTTLDWDSAGGTSYSTLSRVMAISGPPLKAGAAETTNLSSTQSYREFIPGFREAGEPTFKVRFHKTQFALFMTAFNSDTLPAWRINFPLLSGETTPSRWTFTGFIMDLGMPEKGVDGENVWEADVTIKISGVATFTAGS